MTVLPSFLSFLLAIGFIHPAYADPHAVFYTAIGQQQLFFNALAALDQADYVEPAQNTNGTPSGNSRQELLDKRAEAGFPAEDNTQLKATKTDLSAVVTRGVTLEGYDLWSAYLKEQQAVEDTRRRNTDELVRDFCQVGLGRKNCENDINDTEQAAKDQAKAFVRNPVKSAATPVLRGAFEVLLSGLPGQQQEAADAKDLPLAYDANISAWWKRALSDNNKKVSAANLILATASDFIGPQVDPTVWDALTFDSQGRLALNIPTQNNAGSTAYAASSSGSPLDQQLAQSNKELDTVFALATSARAGEGRIQEQTQDTVVDGAVPDLELKREFGANGDSLGEIGSVVTVPAHVKVAATDEGINAVSNTEQDLKYAVPDSENIPGTVETVNRQQAGNGGAVQGIRSTDTTALENTNAAGQVAGIISTDPEEDPTHHEPVKALSPETNIVGFHHEQGPAHLLKAIGLNPDAGCGCSLHTATNFFGSVILNRINGK
jgi:hypothetical protein